MKTLKYHIMLLTLVPLGFAFKALNSKDGVISKSILKSNRLRSEVRRISKQINKNKPKHNVSLISRTEWNDNDGLSYKQVAGANLGATSFAPIDKNETAFLSDATNEIITINNINGKAFRKFKVLFAPRDFVYDPPYFYVLTEDRVAVYNQIGKEIRKYLLPGSLVGVERLSRYNKATYLLLPSGNSLEIERNGNLIEPKEHAGWITSCGMYIKTQLNGNNSYSVRIITPNGNLEKNFTTEKKLAGVFVVGANLTRIVLDMQFYISENPISVERRIVSIKKNKNGFGDIIADTKVPDCYYVLSNKDFYLADDGRIYNMLTAPTGMFVFSLREASSTISKGYPTALNTIQYHFNNHLLKVGN